MINRSAVSLTGNGAFSCLLVRTAWGIEASSEGIQRCGADEAAPSGPFPYGNLTSEKIRNTGTPGEKMQRFGADDAAATSAAFSLLNPASEKIKNADSDRKDPVFFQFCCIYLVKRYV